MYKNYCIIVNKGVKFEQVINDYLKVDTTQASSEIREFFPDRIVTKSFEDTFINNPQMGFYELSDDEVKKLIKLRDIKNIARHFSDNEILLGKNNEYRLNISSSRIEDYISASLSIALYTGSELLITSSDNTGSYIDSPEILKLDIDNNINPWYFDNNPNQSPIRPTTNFRYRNSEAADSIRFDAYGGDWLGGCLDNYTPAVNWGLYMHTVPSNSMDWKVLYQLSENEDENGNPSLQTRDYNYNFSNTGEGVDLIIMDTGVNDQHPEFKYYTIEPLEGAPSGSPSIPQWKSRIIKENWSEYVPSLTASFGVNFQNYYDNNYFEHGTAVASVAAGRYNGWAKGANIYSLKIFGNPAMNLLQAWECVRLFHESKSIDPNTGFKRPTIVNCSYGHTSKLSFTRNINNSTGEQTSDDTTGITQLYYKGEAKYPGYTGSNIIPDTNYGFRPLISGSISGPGTTRIACEYHWHNPVGAVDEIVEQCVDSGVVVITSAGNSNNIATREGDPLYNNYFTHESYPNTNFYYNRTSSPGAAHPDTIIVGAIAPYMVFNKGIIESGSLSGSYMWDMFGPSFCRYGYNVPNDLGECITNGIYQFDHTDVHQYMGTNNRIPKRGYGEADLFPGWEYANNSASCCPASFTTVGSAIDIFAAGESIFTAQHDLDWLVYGPDSNYSNSRWRAIKLIKDYDLYNTNYQEPYQSKYDFLGELGYESSPPFRIPQHNSVQNGTSFSAPQVAGVACLFFSMNPGATPKQFKEFLIEQGKKAIPMWVDNPNKNTSDFTGSKKTTYINNGISSSSRMQYNATGEVNIYGAKPYILHWPYANKGTTSFNNVSLK